MDVIFLSSLFRYFSESTLTSESVKLEKGLSALAQLDEPVCSGSGSLDSGIADCSQELCEEKENEESDEEIEIVEDEVSIIDEGVNEELAVKRKLTFTNNDEIDQGCKRTKLDTTAGDVTKATPKTTSLRVGMIIVST